MPFTYAIVHDGARCLIFKKKNTAISFSVRL